MDEKVKREVLEAKFKRLLDILACSEEMNLEKKLQVLIEISRCLDLAGRKS